jgi:hypothetical protein
MRRIHVLAEGQTEETFVRDLLGPHLLDHGVLVTPVLVSTKRALSGRKFKGGLGSYARLKREVLHLLRDTSAVAVTTMIDFYGLPDDCPRPAAGPSATPLQRAAGAERALGADIGDPRFVPHVSLHEFEALLFVEPMVTAAVLAPDATEKLGEALAAVRGQFAGPEDINDGPATHPARRLADACPSYNKVRHGPLVVARVGLSAARAACPHFGAWLTRLESLGGPEH